MPGFHFRLSPPFGVTGHSRSLGLVSPSAYGVPAIVFFTAVVFFLLFWFIFPIFFYPPSTRLSLPAARLPPIVQRAHVHSSLSSFFFPFLLRMQLPFLSSSSVVQPPSSRCPLHRVRRRSLTSPPRSTALSALPTWRITIPAGWRVRHHCLSWRKCPASLSPQFAFPLPPSPTFSPLECLLHRFLDFLVGHHFPSSH